MVEIAWWLFLVVPLGLALLVFVASWLVIERAPTVDVRAAHVLITGASQGLGAACAELLVKRGARHVTLLSRDAHKLSRVQESLRHAASITGTRLQCIAADVTHQDAFHAALAQAEASFGDITVLMHCAGSAATGHFEQLKDAQFESQFQLNTMGAVHAAQYLVPKMKQRAAAAAASSSSSSPYSARLIFVGSLCSLTGLFGYTAYCPSKFALRGFAEALHMETAPYGIFVSLICPPNIDSPGFVEENRTKPKECALIDEGSGLFSPLQIAHNVCATLDRWTFLSSSGFDGQALTLVSSGTSPCSSALTLTLEFFSVGVLRFVSVFYRRWYMHLINRTKREREKGLMPDVKKSNTD